MARDAYKASHGKDIEAVQLALRNAQTRRNTAGAMMGIGAEYIVTRSPKAAEVLKNACEVNGCRPSFSDLEERWNQLAPQKFDGIKSLIQQMGPHANPGNVNSSMDGNFLTASIQGRSEALS